MASFGHIFSNDSSQNYRKNINERQEKEASTFLTCIYTVFVMPSVRMSNHNNQEDGLVLFIILYWRPEDGPILFIILSRMPRGQIVECRPADQRRG